MNVRNNYYDDDDDVLWHLQLDALDAIDADHSAMTSSTLSGRHQKQLLYVVLPCVVIMIVLVLIITVIIISLLRRRMRYIDKSSEQEAVNLTSFGATQPPPISGLQLCAAQQHQLLLVSYRFPILLLLNWTISSCSPFR